jgi:hypothetical protein
MDGFARMSAVEAAYRDALAERGIPFNRSDIPHPDAVAEAQRLIRMTQAGGLAKDAPQALSRGAMTGNLSVDKAILQFQNFIIHRWALMKHGAFQMGIKEKNPLLGAKIFTYIAVATYAEQLGREGIANAIRMVFGSSAQEESKQKKAAESAPLPARIAARAVVDMATSMPIITNIAGMMRYDSSGVPVADTLKDVTDGIVAASRGKGGGTIRGVQAAGAIVGMPTGQLGDILVRIARATGREPVGPYADQYRFGPGRTGISRDSGPGRTAPERGY